MRIDAQSHTQGHEGAAKPSSTWDGKCEYADSRERRRGFKARGKTSRYSTGWLLALIVQQQRLKLPKTQAPVSVVIPAFNAEQFVAQAIASILGQTFPPAEIVVIDDGSTDGTGAVAAAFAGVRVVRKENGGPGSARNRGVETCSQPFIAFLDADDLWTSGKLEVQMEALARQETPALIFGAAIEFRDTDLDDMPRPLGRALECNLPGALLTRKETLVEIGPFREDRQIGDVLDWYARALDIGVAVVMLEDVVLWRRLHPNNLGRTSKDPAGDYLGILRDIILRRRSGS